MTAALITVDVRTRQQWRAWLANNHASSPGIWLVRHKQHTGVKSMPYGDVVREALCFGWVDSLIPELPVYIAKAFKTNLGAWRHFQALAPTYRRNFVVWIHTAKRPETREKRIRESIELLAAGKKLGLK
jgi:uncharacterized protein YdeI (YjbR/CyaY-like superfamily)